MKLCACIADIGPNSYSKLVEEHKPDLVEHRLDLEKEPAFLPAGLPRIATVRLKSQGGMYDGKESNRIDLLKEAIDIGYEMIDIELEAGDSVEELIRHAKGKAKVIVSFHDFFKTPNNLIHILDKIRRTGADIAKIVPTAGNRKDCAELLSLYKQGFPLIAFSMGETARFTRVASLMLGAPFTYVSIRDKTAPGQYSIGEMSKALGALR